MFTALAAGGTLDTVLNAPAVFVLIGGLCFAFGAYIIGIPLLRLAKAMEVRNGLIDGGAAVRKALPKIQDRIAEATNAVRGEVAGHVDDLKATDAVIASAVNQVAEVAGVAAPEVTMQIAGNTFHVREDWRRPVVRASGHDYVDPRTAAAATDIRMYGAGDDYTPRGRVKDPGAHTMAITTGREKAEPQPDPFAYDPNSPDAAFEYMVEHGQEKYNAMPWDKIDPRANIPDYQQGMTYYTVLRAVAQANFHFLIPSTVEEMWEMLSPEARARYSETSTS
jgi:hypothetical protein